MLDGSGAYRARIVRAPPPVRAAADVDRVVRSSTSGVSGGGPSVVNLGVGPGPDLAHPRRIARDELDHAVRAAANLRAEARHRAEALVADASARAERDAARLLAELRPAVAGMLVDTVDRVLAASPADEVTARLLGDALRAVGPPARATLLTSPEDAGRMDALLDEPDRLGSMPRDVTLDLAVDPALEPGTFRLEAPGLHHPFGLAVQLAALRDVLTEAMPVGFVSREAGR